MPSKSPAQHRFMEAVAHNPEFAQSHGISQKVGKDFVAADKGHKFAHEGVTVNSPAGVSSSGYVQPNGQWPFKTF